MVKAAPTRRRRAWLTFKLSTLFLVVTLVALWFGYPHLHRQIQFQRFKSFVDRDLRELSEEERKRFEAIVNDLLPPTDEFFLLRPENWYLWRMSTNKGDRYLLFQGQHIFMIPGTSSASVVLFDGTGRVAGQSSFSTGWRIDIGDAALLPDKFGEQSVIRIDTTPVINGRDVAAQFYAVIDDRIVLLRLEDSGGKCIDNVYSAPNHTIGPDPVARTEAEWIRALESSQPIETLSALVWLGGVHSSPIKHPGNVSIEDYESATAHQNLCANPETEVIVKRLAGHSQPWIADAAKIALEAITDAAKRSRD